VWREELWDVHAWRKMIRWAQAQAQQPRWAIVPDWIGSGERTVERWYQFENEVPFAKALAVQDGMSVTQARDINPDVICVGGTTEWKWATVEMWAQSFSRVHVLRVNSPQKLAYLHQLGVESCDGTGWNRGDRTQTKGLELWARQNPTPVQSMLSDYVCKKPDKQQLTFL
jgi:hypothetical protein